MRKLIIAITVLLSSCSTCANKNYAFNAGPLRLNCNAEELFAYVAKPWNFSCLIEGDHTAYGNYPVGYVLTLEGDEEFPTAVIRPLERVFNVSVKLSKDYYLQRNGQAVLPGFKDKILDNEIFREGDPRAPLPPIEGENGMNGSFDLTIQLFDLRGEAPVLLSTDKVHGRISCPQCSV